MRKKSKIQHKKFIYDESSVLYTEGFALDKYELADTVRKSERKEARRTKGNIYFRIMELIEERNIFDFFRLSNLIRLEFPELEEGFYDKSATFKAHIDSRRYANLYKLGEKSYDEIANTLEKREKRIEELEKIISDFDNTTQEKYKRIRSEVVDYKCKYEQEKKLNDCLQDRVSTLESEVQYLKQQLNEARILLEFEEIDTR